jgi:hypothetical protein
MTVSWPEPNVKGELNVTREVGVTSSRITSWKISRKEWTQLVVVDVGNT